MKILVELKRRNVFKVSIAYAVTAWLALQLAEILFATFNAPRWVMPVLFVFLGIGFAVSVILAWAYELTPDGMKKTREVPLEASLTRLTGRKLDFFIIGLLSIAVIFLLLDDYVWPTTSVIASGESGVISDTSSPKTIAVLPFANMSGDVGQEFFSDGITEELLNALAKIKGLRVISRTSAFAFKGRHLSIPEIAAALNVDHVLEGSVRKAGNRIRITAQLIDVKSDTRLWSQSYDRNLSDIFAVQDEIARTVAESMQITLLGNSKTAITPARQTQIDVYTDYLLATQKMRDISFANLWGAESLLLGAIERDPEYLPAITALARLYDRMQKWVMITGPEAARRTRPLLDRAMALDDQDGEVWQRLAFVRGMEGDFVGAQAAERRAYELDPYGSDVLTSRVDWAGFSAQPELGLPAIDALLAVDPLSPRGLTVITYLYVRLNRLDDADSTLDRLREIDPLHGWYLWTSANMADGRSDMVRLAELAEILVGIEPNDAEAYYMMAGMYYGLGDMVAADAWLNQALDVARESEIDNPLPDLLKAVRHLDRREAAQALAIAHRLGNRGSPSNIMSRSVALRMRLKSDLVEGRAQESIERYLELYPELANSELPTLTGYYGDVAAMEMFSVSLDLAAIYLHTGQPERGNAILAMVEEQLPLWPKISWLGYNTADADLYAIRGEYGKAIAALRNNIGTGSGIWWRWQLMHNPHLSSIRELPEFAEVLAEYEDRMATELETVRQLERAGKVTRIPTGL